MAYQPTPVVDFTPSVARRYAIGNVDLAHSCMDLDKFMEEVRMIMTELQGHPVDYNFAEEMMRRMTQWYRDHDRYVKYLFESSKLEVILGRTVPHQNSEPGMDDPYEDDPYPILTLRAILSYHGERLYDVVWNTRTGSLISNPTEPE